MEYELDLKLVRKGMNIAVSGKVDLTLSTLERMLESITETPGTGVEMQAASAKPAKKPKLGRNTAYKLLREGRDFDYISERYDCNRQQLAGYKSHLNRKGR